jgi:spermidine/putrescine transport system ATP-binding protein
MNEHAVVAFDDVSKRYGAMAEPAVSAVSMTIGAGEFFSVLGPSGSGKTTALRLIAGFEHPTSGRVLIDGADVSRLPPNRRDVNTVFQNYALFPHMTVADNVGYPLRMRKVARSDSARRVGEALEEVGMSAFTDRLPHQLSGGQRQRVALARALVGRPKVLLLDEPLGALDLHLRQQMQNTLKQLQRDVGITFVYVTHDQGEALAMSDRLAVMSNGVIEQIGTPQEVYHRPATRFVAGFIGRANLVECPVREGHAELSGRRVSVPGVADGTVWLSFRHEAVRLGDAGRSDTDLVLAGRVVDIVFLGEASEIVVDVGGGRSLVSRVVTDRRAIIDRGDLVEVRVSPDDVVVLDV